MASYGNQTGIRESCTAANVPAARSRSHAGVGRDSVEPHQYPNRRATVVAMLGTGNSSVLCATRPKARRLRSKSNVLRSLNRVGANCGSARCKAVRVRSSSLPTPCRTTLDTAPLPPAVQSAVWEYRAIYLVDDQPAGQWSEPASITVTER